MAVITVVGTRGPIAGTPRAQRLAAVAADLAAEHATDIAPVRFVDGVVPGGTGAGGGGLEALIGGSPTLGHGPGATPDDRLWSEDSPDGSVVLAADLTAARVVTAALARDAGRSGRQRPLVVVDLVDVPSLSHALSARAQRPDTRPGLDDLAAAWREKQIRALQDTDRVLVPSDLHAGELAGLEGPQVIVGPQVSPAARFDPERPTRDSWTRHGAIVGLKWADEPGTPDVDGLAALLPPSPEDPVGRGRPDPWPPGHPAAGVETIPGLPLCVVGLDVTPHLRRLAHRLGVVAGPEAWLATSHTSRVGIVSRLGGAPVPDRIVALAGAGVAPIVTPPSVAGTELAALLEDLGLVVPLSSLGQAAADLHADPDRCARAVAAIRAALTAHAREGMRQAAAVESDTAIGAADRKRLVVLPSTPKPASGSLADRAAMTVSEPVGWQPVTVLDDPASESLQHQDDEPTRMRRHLTALLGDCPPPGSGRVHVWIEMVAPSTESTLETTLASIAEAASPGVVISGIGLSGAVTPDHHQVLSRHQTTSGSDAIPVVSDHVGRHPDAWQVTIEAGTRLLPQSLGWVVAAPTDRPMAADGMTSDGSPVWAVTDVPGATFAPIIAEPPAARTSFSDAGVAPAIDFMPRPDASGVRHLHRPLVGVTSATRLSGQPPALPVFGDLVGEHGHSSSTLDAKPAGAPNGSQPADSSAELHPSAPGTERPSVSVIVPTRDRPDLLGPCLERLAATTSDWDVEVVLVDNQTRDPAARRIIDAHEGPVVAFDHAFNFARQVDLGATAASGELLCLFNNDVRPLTDDWLHHLATELSRPGVGAVGARLVDPNGDPAHEGVLVGSVGLARNLALTGSGSPLAWLGTTTRTVSAVTAAVTLTRRNVWEASGGFDGRQRVGFNDVDWCLRVGELGWRVVQCAEALLEHAESASRGSDNPSEDEMAFRRRWGTSPRGIGFPDPHHPRALINPDPVYLRW